MLLYLFICSSAPLECQLHESRHLCLFHWLLYHLAGSVLDPVSLTPVRVNESLLRLCLRECLSLILGLGPRTVVLGRCLVISREWTDAFLGWFAPRHWEAYEMCYFLNWPPFDLAPARLASLLRELYGEGLWQAASPKGSRLLFRSVSSFVL